MFKTSHTSSHIESLVLTLGAGLELEEVGHWVGYHRKKALPGISYSGAPMSSCFLILVTVK